MEESIAAIALHEAHLSCALFGKRQCRNARRTRHTVTLHRAIYGLRKRRRRAHAHYHWYSRLYFAVRVKLHGCRDAPRSAECSSEIFQAQAMAGVQDDAFASWAQECAAALRKMPGALVLPAILQWLPLPDQTRYRVCSREMAAAVDVCVPNAPHILAVVDGLVARGDVVAAEHVLRGFITRHVPSILLNRYVLLLEADVWVPHSPSRASLRRATFAFFEAKVRELGLAPVAVAAPGEFVRTVTADDKFAGEAVSVNVLARVRQACRKWDQDSRAPASERGAFAEPGSASTQVQVHSQVHSQVQVQVQAQVQVQVHRHWHRTGPASTEAACLLAYMCIKDQQLEAARSLANLALEHDPVHPLAHWVDGLIAHYVSRDLNCAARAYAEALVAAPDFAHAYFSLGMLCAECRDHGMTRWLHGRCLFVDPNHHLALISQAFYLPCDGPEFLRQARRVIRIHPTDNFFHPVVALLIVKRAQHVEPGADKRGVTREYLQAVSEAEALLRRATALRPVDTARNWLALACLYLDHFCGRARDAAACSLRVLDICRAAEQRGEWDVAGAKMRVEAVRVLRAAGRRAGRAVCGQ
jgi:hypothetical protein